MGELITILVLLCLGFFCGRAAERKHYKSIKLREAALLHIPAVTLEEALQNRPIAESGLVSGCTCVSIDYFKQFLTGFRMFFGGELRSYSSLIDRARREAILRMKASAPNADAFINVRLETSAISQGENNNVGCVEVLAYATAIKYRDEVRSETPQGDG